MKPSVLIASSTEGFKIAEAIQEQLRSAADCRIWTQDAFAPSGGTLESLLTLVGEHDFGIIVFSPDDKVTIRDKNFVCARDNAVFEGGLFMGRNGRHNTFLVCPENCPGFRRMSDLDGFTTVPYDPNHALGVFPGTATAVRQIRDAIERSGSTRRLAERISLLVAKPGEIRVFPLKVWLELENLGGIDVVLHSAFFRFEPNVKAHDGLRCSAGGREAELWFPGRDHMHTEREFLLKARHSITTFTALSEDDVAKIQELMKNNAVGVFNITGCWLGETPTVRRYRFTT